MLDVSDDVDQLADTAGEYTGATLTKPGMPPDFTICGAYRTEAWTAGFSSANQFQLNGEDGQQWGYVSISALSTYTEYQVSLGHVWLSVTTASVWFLLTWTRVCVSLDTRLLLLRLVGEFWTGQVRIRERYDPLNRNSKSWFSPITRMGIDRCSKIALLNSLDCGQAFMLEVSQKL